MPIHAKAQTISEGQSALELFTDRLQARRSFASYLNDPEPRRRILFFYGDGGNGKSLLLRFLREHYCKRIDPRRWTVAQTADEMAFAAHFEQGMEAVPVPWALLDFAPLPGGDESHQQAFAGLLHLRRQLAGHGLRFPLFDFASIWYLKHKEGLSRDRLKTLFPAEEMDLIAAMADLALSLSERTTVGASIKAGLSLFGKHAGKRLDEWFTLLLQRRGVDAEQVEAIRRMDPDRELVRELPRFFAEDLNAAMRADGAPKRVVLFFDTHEAFWGDRPKREQVGDRYYERDEWLRCLLGSLALEWGIVAVVAGRERPRWAEVDETKCGIPEKHIDAQLVGDLTDADALHYLERTGVSDAALRAALVDYARVGADKIHPLFLGLCADMVRAARGKQLGPDDFRAHVATADKAWSLIKRLLSYVDEGVERAVRALSAARAFDEEVYLTLLQALRLVSPPELKVLTGFSFVWRAEGRGEDWYRIHDLLRRLFAQRPDKNEDLRKAHTALEQLYRERAEAGDDAAHAEAIYHANRLDWKRGVTEWVEAFEQALRLSRYGLCGLLLEVRNELRIETAFARAHVSWVEGIYFATLARYTEAQQEYKEAIDACDAVLEQAHDDVAAHNNKGSVLVMLGDLQKTQADYRAAGRSYTQAIAAFDHALQRAPGLVYPHNNKGNVLQSLGDLQATQADFGAAQHSYTQAIAAYDQALQLAPDYIDAYNNKGNVLVMLGDLQATQADYGAAQHSYIQAIATFDHALQRAPGLVYVHSNKGNVLQRLGDLQATQGDYRAARHSYIQAIAAYDHALQRAPDLVQAHNNKGSVLSMLGDLQKTQGDYRAARHSYIQAIAAFDQALQRAPDLVQAHNNKGTVLQILGTLQLQQGMGEQGLRRLQSATSEYERSLVLAPGNQSIRERLNQVQVLLAQFMMPLEQVLDGLPSAIREAMEHGDQPSFELAFSALSPTDRQPVAAALLRLQVKQADDEDGKNS